MEDVYKLTLFALAVSMQFTHRCPSVSGSRGFSKLPIFSKNVWNPKSGCRWTPWKKGMCFRFLFRNSCSHAMCGSAAKEKRLQ